jgi:hypothetical protein
MEKMILHQLLWALAFTVALDFTSCNEENEMLLPNPGPAKETTNAVTPEGGILSALDDNVVLTIPEGALSFTENFTVNACQAIGNCPYLIHPIYIEPFVTFNKPVALTIRFTGCLCYGNVFDCHNNCVKVLNWGNSRDFLEQFTANEYNGIINQSKGTIDLIIYQTGVFAISPAN